jgi:hypothetical protein
MPENKVTVRIWLPTNMGVKGRIARAAGVGHASLTLKVGGNKYYITWTAHGSPFAGFKLDAYHYIDEFTKGEDKDIMQNYLGSWNPTYKIHLKTKQPNSPDGDEGLDAEAIEDFWLDRLDNRPKYAFLSRRKNCTGCVADALRAGGLEQYVPAPNNWVVQDAGSLLAWVLKAEQRWQMLSGG